MPTTLAAIAGGVGSVLGPGWIVLGRKDGWRPRDQNGRCFMPPRAVARGPGPGRVLADLTDRAVQSPAGQHAITSPNMDALYAYVVLWELQGEYQYTLEVQRGTATIELNYYLYAA